MTFSISAWRLATFGLLLTMAFFGLPAQAAYTAEDYERMLASGCSTLSDSHGDRRHAGDVVKSFDYRSLAGNRLSGFAMCAALAGDHQLAITVWSRFIESTPLPYDAHYFRARSHLALGQTGAAIRDLQTSLDRDLSPEDDLRLLAKIHSDRGDNLAAVKLLEGEKRTIEARDPQPGSHVYSPGEEWLALELSAAYMSLGNVAVACSTLEWGFTRNNLSSKLFDALILCLKKSRKPKAIETYRKIGCSNPVVSKSSHCKSD